MIHASLMPSRLGEKVDGMRAERESCKAAGAASESAVSVEVNCLPALLFPTGKSIKVSNIMLKVRCFIVCHFGQSYDLRRQEGGIFDEARLFRHELKSCRGEFIV
jgi:hypothetical protein